MAADRQSCDTPFIGPKPQNLN